jgi:NTP pyrophosphatase (non-canonical NTP hydrolase)
MELKALQQKVLEYDRARGWDYFHPLEIFMNMNEEMAEIWQKIAWVNDAQKLEKAAEHREAIEFDIGDLLIQILKLSNQFGVDAERGLERVLESFGQKFPPKNPG